MITEHNYPTLYYTVITAPDGPRYLGESWMYLIEDRDQAKLFSHPGDAQRWAERGGHSGKYRLAIVEFPFVIEYQDGPIWQKLRYYRTLEVALAAWPIQVSAAARSPIGQHLWRLRHLKNDQVYREGRPAQIPQSVKPAAQASQNVKPVEAER